MALMTPKLVSSAENNTAGVTSANIGALARNAGDVIVVHAACNHDSSSPAPDFTISDDFGLTWNTRANLTHARASDGDQGRLKTFWAVVPVPRRYTITVNYGVTVEASIVHAMVFQNVDPVTPFDANGSLPATSTHSATAQGEVTGVSTDQSDAFVLLTYFSIGDLDSPGVASGFSAIQDATIFGGNGQTVHTQGKVITSAESSATYTFPTSTDDVRVLADVLRGPASARSYVRFCEGFDALGARDDINLGAALGSQSSGSGPVPELITGRGGYGQALRLPVDFGDAERWSWYTTFTDLMGGETINDGDVAAVGFAVYLGENTVGTPVGPGSVMRFISGSGTFRLEVAYDPVANAWSIWDDVVGDTELDEGSSPDVNPYQQWVCVEVEIFRHATEGYVRVYQERPGSSFDLPPWHRGILPAPSVGVPGTIQMELVAEFNGDTSVATRGSINGFMLLGNKQPSTDRFGNAFDDLYYAIGGRVGRPWRVLTDGPNSDVSSSGFAASTGSDLFALIDEAIRDNDDYIVAAAASGPNALFGFPNLGYSPAELYAYQAGALSQQSGGGSTSQARMTIYSNGDDAESVDEFQGIGSSLEQSPVMCWSRDPDTGDYWTYGRVNSAEVRISASDVFTGEWRVYTMYRQALVSRDEGAPYDVIGAPSYPGLGMHPIEDGVVESSASLQPLTSGLPQP